MSSQQMGQAQGVLSAAARAVAEARLDLDRLDTELVRHLDEARTRWSGQGAAAFWALGLAWSDRQRTIVGALDGFAAALRSTEQLNTATDDAQAAAFGRARGRLG